MTSSYDTFKGLWRASANEAVPYTDDFPECLLVTPEFWDGSIVQGNATSIKMSIHWISDTRLEIVIRDNGEGIKNERRLLQWAAAKAVSTIHKNGHGLKKGFTKYMRDFDTAKWTIHYRKKNRNVQVISAPFLGTETKVEEDEHDEVSLMPSGTEIRFQCDASVLGKYSANPQGLFHALREIITTRYSEEVLGRVDFQIEVKQGEFSVAGSSRADEWHSFEWQVAKRIPREVHLKMSLQATIPGGTWTYKEYFLHINGSTGYDLKSEGLFPVYGRKNQKTSRVHTFVDGRMIEAIPYYRILGRDTSHNNENGLFGFWHFTPTLPEDFDKMPQPATTKVSFYENDPIFRQMLTDLATRKQQEEEAQLRRQQEEEQQRRVEAQRAAEATRAARAQQEQQQQQQQQTIQEVFQRVAGSESGNAVIQPPPRPHPARQQEALNSELAFYKKLKELTTRLRQIDFKDEMESAETTPNTGLLATFRAIERIHKTLDEI